jgi:peptidyl-tRNA hydrolase
MRRGKEISQGAHASMMWLIDRLNHTVAVETHPPFFAEDEKEWMRGLFTKVTVQVDSEKELLDLYNKAIAQSLNAYYVIDVGKTEFDGVRTMTALAIGPNESEKVDLVTKELKLY